MKVSKFINKIMLLVIIFSISCFVCACGKSKENKHEKFIKDQFMQLCNVEVEITDGENKDITYDNELRHVYSCKVKIGDELYDTVATLDEEGHTEMYTMYEEEFPDVFGEDLYNFDYWGYEPEYEGQNWGLDGYSASAMYIRTDLAFPEFAEALTKVDIEKLGTGCFVRVIYLNNNIIIPISREYTAEDYIVMLEKLRPGIDIIPKEEKHEVMFNAYTWTAGGMGYDIIGYSFTIYYDGTITYTERVNEVVAKVVGEAEMSDYDYSLIRSALQDEFIGYEYEIEVYDGIPWIMTYYDINGEALYSFDGCIYDSDLLEYRIWNVLNKYDLIIND